MSSRAHGDTTELHGPLQRLLDVAQALFLCLAMSLVHFSLRHPMLVDVRLARFRVYVEAKPHALSHTTKQSSGTATSNGEVEGPRDGARLEPRAEHLPQRPRRHYRASRPPPTIVRRHSACGQSHLPPPPPLPPRRPPPPSADTRDSQPEAVTILQCCDRAKHTANQTACENVATIPS